MIDRLFNILVIPAIIFLGLLLVLALPSFTTPHFDIKNLASDDIKVSAVWRETQKQLGEISPGTTKTFDVDDETGMTFIVRYVSGAEVKTEPKYFTRGVTVVVTVSDDTVSVRYGDEK